MCVCEGGAYMHVLARGVFSLGPAHPLTRQCAQLGYTRRPAQFTPSPASGAARGLLVGVDGPAAARAIVARERILAGFEGDSLDQPTPQVLGNMGGQSGEMGTGKGGMGPAAPKGIGGRSEATGPGGGAATPATEEPSKASGGMGSM